MRFLGGLRLSIALSLPAVVLLFFMSVFVRAQGDLPDDDTCLSCHEYFDRTLIPTKHRLSSQTEGPVIRIACTNCHPGAKDHIEDPSKENITTAAELPYEEARRVCRQCHKAHNELDNYGFDPHSTEGLSCADCHKVHGSKQSLLLDEKAEFCLRCHENVRLAFKKASRHPVLQKNLNCLSCHRFVKRMDRSVSYNVFGICKSCHPEQGGPFPYEHEAINAYAIEGSGCTECHDPHGSENNRLLRRPGSDLCKQCHMPSEHLVAHGGIWAGYPCANCHTETHGSYTGNLLLDPNLPSKFAGDCFNAGCHSLNR